MTKEEIKNIVRHVFHFYEANVENCNWTDMNEACGEIFKALEQQPKWIPVSERLPEDGRPVLIYAWSVHHVVARYDKFRTESGYKECWVTADAWNGNTEIKHEVIAWMPLPEP